MSFDVLGLSTNLTREEWLAVRKYYIGGSDAGAVLGLNPWKSPLDVWLDKKSKVEEKEEPTYRMKLGNILEDTVAKLFEEETGKTVRRDNRMMVSKENPFMMANIDRRVVGENSILECKTTTQWNKKFWKNNSVPLSYQIQCHHYMVVTGADKCYIACMIGFTDFVIREIERDEAVIELLIEGEKEFHDLLKDPSNPLPKPDGSPAYTNALNEKFGVVEHVEPTEIDVNFKHYFELKETISVLEKEKEKIEQQAKLQLGSSDIGKCGKYQATWKEVVSERLDTKKIKKESPEIFEKYKKVSKYRRFSVKELKEEE